MIFKRVESIREVSWKLIHKSIHVVEDCEDYSAKINGHAVGYFRYFSILDGKIPEENGFLISALLSISNRGYAKKAVEELIPNSYHYLID